MLVYHPEISSFYKQSLHKLGTVMEFINRCHFILGASYKKLYLRVALCEIDRDDYNDYRMSKRLFSFRQADFIGFCIIKFQKI